MRTLHLRCPPFSDALSGAATVQLVTLCLWRSRFIHINNGLLDPKEADGRLELDRQRLLLPLKCQC